jgi:tetratricopeptide (TPR) repeat protein
METTPKSDVTTGLETTTTAADIQRFHLQCGPLNNTLSTSEGAFFRRVSPDSQDTEGLTTGQADTERPQNDRVAPEYLEALGRIKQQLDELSISVESRLRTSTSLEQKSKSFGDADSAYRAKSEVPVLAPKTGELSNPEFLDSSYLLKMHEPRFGHETLGTTAKNRPTNLADKAGQNRAQYPTVSGIRTAKEVLPEDIADLSRADMSRQANGTIAGHKKYSSFAAHEFSRHVQDAESYLREGKYYKAAEYFTLALSYSRDNPQALVGKSHALFAAGEYISSALFLTRALAINPEYVKVKVDLVTLLGGPNKLTRRITDIERWFARSGSGRLQLLLGYVYYKTGRLSEAKRAIKAAGDEMSESPAVDAIMSAISDAELSR